MKRIQILYTFFLILQVNLVYSQDFRSIFLEDSDINPLDSNKLFFNFHNTNFFKNNEYFDKIDEGYTLIGYWMQPTLSYYPYSKVKLEAGGHFLKYSGKSNFTSIQPVFRCQYQISKSVAMILGTIYGSENHQYIEPLYRFEKQLDNFNENGLQFLINAKHFRSDVWLNWENFIFIGDSAKERLSAGTSTDLIFPTHSGKFNLKIPLQLVVAHRGGQIDISEENMQTLVNLSAGINLEYYFTESHDFFVRFENHFLKFSDNSPEPEMQFKNGKGFYSKLCINAASLLFSMHYWSGNQFISARGEPYFMSISQNDVAYTEKKRELLGLSLLYSKKIKHGLSFGAGADVFFNISTSNLDYSYSAYLIYNGVFKLKNQL